MTPRVGIYSSIRRQSLGSPSFFLNLPADVGSQFLIRLSCPPTEPFIASVSSGASRRELAVRVDVIVERALSLW